MNYANVFTYAIDVIGLFEHPSEFEKALRPTNVIAAKWVPQTISDEVWVFYEFATLKEKKDFAKQLKGTVQVRVLHLTDEDIQTWVG